MLNLEYKFKNWIMCVCLVKFNLSIFGVGSTPLKDNQQIYHLALNIKISETKPHLICAWKFGKYQLIASAEIKTHRLSVLIVNEFAEAYFNLKCQVNNYTYVHLHVCFIGHCNGCEIYVNIMTWEKLSYI